MENRDSPQFTENPHQVAAHQEILVPQNPTGTMIRESELKEIISLIESRGILQAVFRKNRER